MVGSWRCHDYNNFMITDLFLYFGGLIILLFNTIFSIFGNLLPAQFLDSINYFMDYIMRWEIFFPVSTLMSALSVLISFWIALYSIKILMWLIKHIPFINRGLPNNLPKIKSK